LTPKTPITHDTPVQLFSELPWPLVAAQCSDDDDDVEDDNDRASIIIDSDQFVSLVLVIQWRRGLEC